MLTLSEFLEKRGDNSDVTMRFAFLATETYNDLSYEDFLTAMRHARRKFDIEEDNYTITMMVDGEDVATVVALETV